MSKIFPKIFFCLLVFIIPAFFISTVYAAYDKFSPGEAVIISEFVYNDDFSPSTASCSLSVYKPNGDAFTLPGGSTMDIDESTGRHYKSFTPDGFPGSTTGTWPAVMSCGTPGSDLSKLDKTFLVGYANTSNTDIASAVWGATNRSLDTVSNIASATWNWTGRSLDNITNILAGVWDNVLSPVRQLTSRQITTGEYIVGVTSSTPVTQVASAQQATDIQAKLGTGTVNWDDISAIKTKTNMINWDDVTGIVSTAGAIQTKLGTTTINWDDIAGIITTTNTIQAKLGTGTVNWDDISAIKTKTNMINWDDVTGIVSTAGAIQTKLGTTTINWDDISAIKTKTNTINWDDVTGIVSTAGDIKTKLGTTTINWDDVTGIIATTDAIQSQLGTATINWADISSIRSSQQSGWTVSLSNFGRTNAGQAYRAKLQVLNYESTPTDPAVAPVLTIYDPNRAEKVSGGSMIKDSSGTYHYDYTISADATAGVWETQVSVQTVAGKTIIVNDYWEVEAPVPHVSVDRMIDTTISGSSTDSQVSAYITIVNEGLSWYEYHYEWCVVTNFNTPCSSSDVIFRGTDSTRINPGITFNDTLTADNVFSAGAYYFKLIVYYGTETSGASRSFIATIPATTTCGDRSCNGLETCSSCPADCGICSSGGGGGGGAGPTPPITTTCNGADFNHDKKVDSVDFSILLAFWKTIPPFKNACVDINKDQKVDSVDFSILMYQWGTKK